MSSEKCKKVCLRFSVSAIPALRLSESLWVSFNGDGYVANGTRGLLLVYIQCILSDGDLSELD